MILYRSFSGIACVSRGHLEQELRYSVVVFLRRFEKDRLALGELRLAVLFFVLRSFDQGRVDLAHHVFSLRGFDVSGRLVLVLVRGQDLVVSIF